MGNAKNQTAFALANARPLARFLNQLLQRENFGATKLVGFSCGVVVENTLRDGISHVFNPHSLKTCVGTGQGHDGGDALKLRKQV